MLAASNDVEEVDFMPVLCCKVAGSLAATVAQPFGAVPRAIVCAVGLPSTADMFGWQLL
jgi:hypothetical protein